MKKMTMEKKIIEQKQNFKRSINEHQYYILNNFLILLILKFKKTIKQTIIGYF